MNPSTPEPYLTAEQLASLLGMSQDWVYDRAKSCELPSYVLPGGRRRFLFSEVQESMRRWRADPPRSVRLEAQ